MLCQYMYNDNANYNGEHSATGREVLFEVYSKMFRHIFRAKLFMRNAYFSCLEYNKQCEVLTMDM